MLSRFFIDRPIFANVIAIITAILGLVTVVRLPVEQYPEITPPTVQVSTMYPGANATRSDGLDCKVRRHDATSDRRR